MACTENMRKHVSPKLALLAKLKDCKRSYHSTVAVNNAYIPIILHIRKWTVV